VLKFNALQLATLTDATEKNHMRFAFDIAAILGEKIDKPLKHLFTSLKTSNKQQTTENRQAALNLESISVSYRQRNGEYALTLN
jgi:hypothetical protein